MDQRSGAIRKDPLALNRSLGLEEMSLLHQQLVRQKAMALKCDIRNLRHLENSNSFLADKKITGKIPRNMVLDIGLPELPGVTLSAKFMRAHRSITAKTEAECTTLWTNELRNIYNIKKAETKTHKAEILKNLKAEDLSEETKAPMLEVFRSLKVVEKTKPLGEVDPQTFEVERKRTL